jgi:hypothetical protein
LLRLDISNELIPLQFPRANEFGFERAKWFSDRAQRLVASGSDSATPSFNFWTRQQKRAYFLGLPFPRHSPLAHD